jgi:hypothetical protein
VTCADLLCEDPATSRLRYQGRDQTRLYELCEHHLDQAHLWLADRPHLAATAVSERLVAALDQPALF